MNTSRLSNFIYIYFIFDRLIDCHLATFFYGLFRNFLGDFSIIYIYKKKERIIYVCCLFPPLNQDIIFPSLSSQRAQVRPQPCPHKGQHNQPNWIIYQIKIFRRFMWPEANVNSTSRFVSTLLGKVASMISKIWSLSEHPPVIITAGLNQQLVTISYDAGSCRYGMWETNRYPRQVIL